MEYKLQGQIHQSSISTNKLKIKSDQLSTEINQCGLTKKNLLGM